MGSPSVFKRRGARELNRERARPQETGRACHHRDWGYEGRVDPRRRSWDGQCDAKDSREKDRE